jgi:hypothetical protein
LLVLAPLAAGAGAAEGTVTYKHESEAEFRQQLAARKIQRAIVNKRLRTLRLTLTDGTHVLAAYPKHEEPATVTRLKGAGVTVTILSKSAASKEAKEAKHGHHIRYIIGGIVVVVIVIVAVVLLVNRRRRQSY